MSAKVPEHAVVASFQFEDGAGNALAKLKDLNESEGLGIHNAAVLRVGNDGKLHVRETEDMSGRKGMVVGGVVGGVIGLLGTSILWPLGVGAAIGGLASHLRDSGFSNQRLKEAGERLKPGDSVLIVAVEDADVETVSAFLKDAGADLIREAIDGKVVEELETKAAALATSTDMAASSVAEPPKAEEAPYQHIDPASSGSPSESHLD